MWKPACLPIPTYTAFVCEDTLAKYGEEEIATIRVVLSRLTAIRIMNAADAEDLVQDTLLTVAMKTPEVELEKGLLVWSMGVLRNKVGNYYRKAQRQSALSPVARASHRAALGVSPEGLLCHRELRLLIERLLAELPEQQSRALRLLLAGFQPSEIAAMFHPCRYQTVINWLHRGKKRLARELIKHGYRPQRQQAAGSRQ